MTNKKNNIQRPTHTIVNTLQQIGLLRYWFNSLRTIDACISKLIIIGSHYGLLPSRRQAIIWTSAGILLIGPLGTNFSEIVIEIYIFLFKEIGGYFLSGSMC